MATLFSSENKNRLLSSNSCYIVGVLAENEEYYPTSGEEQAAVTGMKGSSNIIFFIKPLSKEPEPITELLQPILLSDLYIGVDNHQYNQSLFSLAYKFTTDIERKKQMIRDKFRGKLVLFRPKIQFTSKDNKEYVYKNMEVINVEPDIEVNDKMEYAAIPQVSMSNSDFERKLLSKSTILLDDYNHAMAEPEYILCGGYLYYNFPDWKRHNTNNKLWVCEKGMGKIYRIKINTEDKELKSKLIRGTDNIVFMEKEFLKKNIESQKGEDIEVKPLPHVFAAIPTQEPEKESEALVSVPAAPNVVIDNGEYKFLMALKQLTIREKLCYELKDLVNFHICVKTNPITILAGMSGTGKTQLALSYAKMLDLSEEEGTLLFLPISPSYTEPGDLLGYLNNTNGLFIPSETGFVDFLVHAKDFPDKMHMVVFDEMNLSQVEHWFAPFISLLEKDAENRLLRIYSSKANCINSDRYPSVIPIGSNIAFIGTVNMDETTKDFSDRLLDRANIVVLDKMNFVQLREEQEREKFEEKTYEQFICSSLETYTSWHKKDDPFSAYTIDELEFLDELHGLIQEYDFQKGVSFRIACKIGEYLNNIPTDDKAEGMLSREDAFDIEIKQRLITKIKGMEKQYESLIGTVRDNNAEIPLNSRLYEFFNSDKARRISHFNRTKKEILRKAKELSIYGYTS